MRPTGKINLIGVAILLAVAGGLYWLITFGPAYLDNLDVKDAIAAAFNQYNVGEREENVRTAVLMKLNHEMVGWHVQTDEWGNTKDVGGLGLKPEDVIIEADDVNKTLRVAVVYTRLIRMKPLSKVRHIRFVVEKKGKLEK